MSTLRLGAVIQLSIVILSKFAAGERAERDALGGARNPIVVERGIFVDLFTCRIRRYTDSD